MGSVVICIGSNVHIQGNRQSVDMLTPVHNRCQFGYSSHLGIRLHFRHASGIQETIVVPLFLLSG